MRRSFALLSLLLCACATETRYEEATGQDDAGLMQAAVDAWSTVGVETPDTYAIVFLALEDLQAECEDPSPYLAGCAVPTAGAVLLLADGDADLQRQSLIHEVGHLIKGTRHLDHGRLPHLDCQGAQGDVMCAVAAPAGTFPTARDAAFVRAR